MFTCQKSACWCKLARRYKHQSWTKSVENFALCYPQNAYSAGLVTLWPLPHRPTLVKVVLSGWEMIQLGFNIVFWGEGGVFVVNNAFKIFILKLNMVRPLFLNIYVQD